jgi:hypothetical protein
MLDETLPKIKAFEEDAAKFSSLGKLFDQGDRVQKEPFTYNIGAMVLDVSIGSVDAFNFIKSLVESPNDEVLRSEIVRRYSNYMWQ